MVALGRYVDISDDYVRRVHNCRDFVCRAAMGLSAPVVWSRLVSWRRRGIGKRVRYIKVAVRERRNHKRRIRTDEERHLKLGAGQSDGVEGGMLYCSHM